MGQALAALADPTRRAVVELLARGPRRAGELAAALGMSPPTLSRHLRVLRRGGLIADDEPEHDARVRLYRLQPQALQPLQGWLAELESFWGEQLQAFQAHAERAAEGAAAAAAARAPGAPAGGRGDRQATPRAVRPTDRAQAPPGRRKVATREGPR